MLCYQPEFLRLVPCYQHLSTMSKGKVKSSQRSEMFFREKNTNGNFHEEIATPWLTQGQDVCTWNLFVVRSSLQFLAFELQCHGVTWSRRWWPEVMQLSRNDLRRSLCACRATSCDTVKRALCAFVQHKGKEIKRKSQKRTPKGFSKAFELFVVSENFETTRVREKNELSGERQNHRVFFWDFDPHSSHGLSASGHGEFFSRRLQAEAAPQRPQSARGFSPRVQENPSRLQVPKWQPKTSKNTSKNTPKMHPNLSHEFIPCLFCIFLGFVLVLVFGRILWKRSYFATEILGITHYTALQNSWTSFDFMLSTLEFEIFRTSSLVSLRFRFSTYGETCGVTEGGGRTAAHWIRLREEERRRRRDPYEMNSENVVQFKHLKQGIHFAHISTFSYPYCLGLIGCTFLGWLLVRVGRRLDRTYL